MSMLELNRTKDIPQKFGGSITQPSRVDVLCGRGGLVAKHPGNIYFRLLVKQLRCIYRSKETKKADKIKISAKIVEHIRYLGGRFLIEDGNVWKEIGDKCARRKTAQAMREKKKVVNDHHHKTTSQSKSENTVHHTSQEADEFPHQLKQHQFVPSALPDFFIHDVNPQTMSQLMSGNTYQPPSILTTNSDYTMTVDKIPESEADDDVIFSKIKASLDELPESFIQGCMPDTIQTMPLLDMDQESLKSDNRHHPTSGFIPQNISTVRVDNKSGSDNISHADIESDLDGIMLEPVLDFTEATYDHELDYDKYSFHPRSFVEE